MPSENWKEESTQINEIVDSFGVPLALEIEESKPKTSSSDRVKESKSQRVKESKPKPRFAICNLHFRPRLEPKRSSICRETSQKENPERRPKASKGL